MKEKKEFWKFVEVRGLFWCYVIIGITFSVISIIVPMVSGELVNAVIYEQNKLGNNLLQLIVVYGFMLLFSVTDQYCSNLFLVKQKKGMREKAFGAFLRKKNQNREQIASFVSFVNNDIPAIAENYFQGSVDILKCSCIAVCASVALLQIHWLLAGIIVGCSVAIVVMPRFVQEKAAMYREEYAKALEKYNTIIESYLGGADIVRAYLYSRHALAKTEMRNYEIAKKEQDVRKCQVWVYTMAGTLQILKSFLILAIGVYLIYTENIRVGELLVAVQLAEVLAAPIEVLAYLINGKNEIKPLVKKYQKIYEKTEMTGTEQIDKIETIQMEHVTVSVNGTNILKDFSATFLKGKKYMLTGQSGSGKSMVLRLLGKLLDEQYEGNVLVNRTDFDKLDEETFYQKVGIVSQEPYLFWASMEENILLGRQISKEDYLEVVQKLNLEYLLKRFECQSLDEESVSRLSGGEKQRIALARAMVGKPEIYLLDEVTSSLDEQNAGEIEEILLQENAMIIYACHKMIPELKAKYDTIICLDS